jgi:hypothetical protein
MVCTEHGSRAMYKKVMDVFQPSLFVLRSQCSRQSEPVLMTHTWDDSELAEGLIRLCHLMPTAAIPPEMARL